MMRQSFILRSSSRHMTKRKNYSVTSHQEHCCNARSRPMRGANVLRENARWLHFQPLPMPAVARCDYDVHDYHERDDASTIKTDAASFSVASEITMTSSNDGNSPRFLGNNYRVGSGGSTTGGSGGNKGPPHRCPKCGATVTFQESSAASSSNRIQNCFYCAACSGWFLVQPQPSQQAEEHSKYLLSKMSAEHRQVGEKKEHGIPTKRNVLEPQFVMQDVSFLYFQMKSTSFSNSILSRRLNVIHYRFTFHSTCLLLLSRHYLLTSPCFSSSWNNIV